MKGGQHNLSRSKRHVWGERCGPSCSSSINELNRLPFSQLQKFLFSRMPPAFLAYNVENLRDDLCISPSSVCSSIHCNSPLLYLPPAQPQETASNSSVFLCLTVTPQENQLVVSDPAHKCLSEVWPWKHCLFNGSWCQNSEPFKNLSYVVFLFIFSIFLPCQTISFTFWKFCHFCLCCF